MGRVEAQEFSRRSLEALLDAITNAEVKIVAVPGNADDDLSGPERRFLAPVSTAAGAGGLAEPGDDVGQEDEGTAMRVMSDQSAIAVFAPQDLAAQEERSISRLLSFLDAELAALPAACRLAPLYRECRSAVEQAWPRGPRSLS
jgi:hypothetical protein